MRNNNKYELCVSGKNSIIYFVKFIRSKIDNVFISPTKLPTATKVILNSVGKFYNKCCVTNINFTHSKLHSILTGKFYVIRRETITNP